MFKEVPGNANYVINLNGQIKRKDGRECTLPSSDTTVELTLFREKRWVSKEWLALMAHFEVKLTGSHSKLFWTIDFEDVPSEVYYGLSGKRMVLVKPMYLNFKMRLVPGLLHVAVSEDGTEVVEKVDGQWISRNIQLTGDYLKVKVYDPDRNKALDVGVHRLVALAWVVNPEPNKFNVVNHIDGNKQNAHRKNLEWCDIRLNNIHARDTGLRADAKPCRLLDFETQEVYRFPSTSEACSFMGLQRTNLQSLLGVRKHKLIRGRYELRLADDNRPWSKPEDFKKVKGRYVITVKLPDGQEVFYNDIRDLKKDFKIWNVNAAIDKYAERLSELHPGVTMTWVDQFAKGPYQAKSISTGEVFEAETASELGKLCGVDKSVVIRGLNLPSNKVSLGHQFRIKTDEPWPEKIETYGSLPKCILAIHPSKGELIFQSLRKTAEHFNADKSAIRVRLNNKQPYKNWTFREITKH